MDHPFDDLAVKAADRAIEQTVGMDWPSKDCAQAALTAACNSMKERGKVEEGHLQGGMDYLIHGYPIEGTTYPVTIFRHGE